ncbi:hypothetical protein MBLNU459_g3765t1 [Dothideomycetes sp. NU459]
MSGMPGLAAPGGGQQMANMGTPSNAPSDTEKGYRLKLHTYIYDYFLKTEQYDLARALQNTLEIQHSMQPKQSPDTKGANGVNDLDKDKSRRPDDLPLAEVPSHHLDGSFLFDWWCQFWDLFGAQRGKGNPATKQYLNNVQARMSSQQRMMRMDPQMQASMGAMRNGMMQGTPMAMSSEMAKKMGAGAGGVAGMPRNPTPQQMQHMQQQFRMQQQMQMQQTQMQREGSSIDMNGQQRLASPGSVADAPSPKRQRLDGSFNGPMGPMGRGQPQGMPGQQFNGMQMQNQQPKSTQQVYAQQMARQMQSAMDSNSNKGMPGNPSGLPQGSPAMDASNPDFFNAAAQMRGGIPGQGPPTNNSNHALQDYQMQLMLLEQQNKKRLLMARQEQDNMTNGPGGPAPPGGPVAFAPTMSPSGSRAGGPSPTPNEMKLRGTPKMSQGAVPSPTPDGPMGQGRASPAPGFDPSQMNPNLPPGMFPQMNKMGMMGPNGQMMQPPSSHPGFNAPMNQQQMEMFRAQQQNGGRMPNGFIGGGPPQMMPGQQPGPQQPPNMTPQQRNAMPPPPAPTGDSGRGTQPSSPQQQQQAAPPTPSQANKANTKSRKDNNSKKKAPAKKGTGATPASEAEAPPTPTPAPPITPTQANANFPPKSGPGPAAAQNAMVQQNQPDMGVGSGPFGHLDGNDFNSLSFDIGPMDGTDVLDNFDFDSFLTNGDGDGSFGFDANIAFGDGGLEAGGPLAAEASAHGGEYVVIVDFDTSTVTSDAAYDVDTES